ncbi:MAG TPA: S9 family peptidase [Methylocystis sp.]|nr:S9 family peptidase [Methylocystis sp.]
MTPRKFPIFVALTLAALAAALPAGAGETAQGALIPRKVLFGNPVKSGAQVSPDGKWISWLAPRDGVMNVWVGPIGHPEDGFFVTHETRRVLSFTWTYSGTHILFPQDTGGDENYHIYATDLEKREPTDLTPFKGARAGIDAISPKIRDEVLITLNKRDPKYFDLYRLNYRTGELALLRENAEYAGFLTDDDYRVRFAMKTRDDGGIDYLRLRDDGELEPWLKIAPEDSRTTGILELLPEKNEVLIHSSKDRDTSALYRVDLKSGARKLFAEDPRADVGALLTDQKTHEPLAYSTNYERNIYHVLDDSVREDFAFLHKTFNDDWGLQSRSEDDRYWVIGSATDVRLPSAYLYDRAEKTLKKLYDSRPELADTPFAAMHPIVIKSRDGLNLVSYLTLPLGSDDGHPGRPEKPAPLVLDVHGGPWGRVGFGFSGHAQWLANRGYAVLSVNFRSSTGFGKNFINAGDHEWGGKMDDDLIDAVSYAIDRKIADPDHIAITGGSYGGYATLVGLTREPKTYACGVDTVGPSDLVHLLSTVPPYWTSGRAKWLKAVGDPATAQGLQLLQTRSPLRQADRIERPLMILQGEHDPRVVKAQSDMIADKLKEHGIPVTYVLVKNEGHGFAQPENVIAVQALTESFLGHCLGGRAEPLHADELKASTIEVLAGAELIDGYVEAKAAAEAK